jgi:hypothetical protein
MGSDLVKKINLESLLGFWYEIVAVDGQKEYVLFGSLPLILRGILWRDPHDIDVFVTKRVWGALLAREDTWHVETPDAGNPPILVSDKWNIPVHLFYEWAGADDDIEAAESIQQPDIVDGWRCVSVSTALRMKEAAFKRGHSKHWADILAIDAYQIMSS